MAFIAVAIRAATIWLGRAAKVAALAAFASSIAGSAEPQLLINDPLIGNSQSVERVGGLFLAEGWQAVKDTDYLRYKLPDDIFQATVQFEASGIRMGAPGDARKHLFAVADRYLGPSTFYNATNSTTIMLSVWASERDGSQPGKTRLRNLGLAYGAKDTSGSRFQADSQPLVWDADRWHHFHIRWTQTGAAFSRDGQEISSIAYPDRHVPFQHVFINMAHYGIDMHGYNGAVYRKLKITTP
jgi:hypothetical protein